MSSKIGISPDEITAAITSLPPLPSPVAGEDALSAALTVMQAVPKAASTTRVIFYRYDIGPTAQADTFQAQVQGGDLPLHAVARELDCDLQLIELGHGPTDATETARACAFGMMAAEQDTALLVVAAFGAGSDERTCDENDFFATTTPETAAIMGAMVAAARAGIPIIAEGPQGLAAAKALGKLHPGLTPTIFLCGIAHDVPGFHVFADAEKSDKGYAAIMLAAMLKSEFAKAQAA